MRMRLIITMALACALLACSLFTRPDEPVERAADPSAPSPSTGSPPTSASAAQPYFGEQSIEERIANADTIVKARLATTTSEVIDVAVEGWSGSYAVVVKFHMKVSEYLNGSGANNITVTAVWWNSTLKTRREAEDTLPDVLARRDTSWDSREAIIFLNNSDPGGYFSNLTQGENDHFLVYWADLDDGFSLHSRYRKVWLPSAGTSGIEDDQEFLLAAPEPGRDTPTITIRELKSRISAINTEVNAGDGSDAYRNCVSYKYRNERSERHFQSEGRKLRGRAALTHRLVSGSSAGTVIFESGVRGIYPDTKMQTSFEGGDAGLFETVDGPTTPDDWNRDGVLTDGIDFIRYTQSLRPVRPIPAGEYSFTVKDLEANMIPCNAFLVTEWTVIAIAPEGTLHEAFFDPVTDGSAVAADSANGVLRPASFTDANGATSTIQRIAWEPGTVKMRVSPHDGLASHAVDFITLDGSVSLSLNVADATVDAATDMLSWLVAAQPWQSGDKLMVRIREAPDCSMGAVTDTRDNPGLARDCEILLVVMDTLRGTGTLNWDVSLAMATWDGVAIGGSPTRVTRLELANKGLDGNIPEYLGRLLGLTHLDLSRNSLTGAIPAELGRLSNLESLRLSGNSLTGCIPVALMSVATNDLSSLDLLYCRPPAPENLTAGTPSENNIPLSWDPVANAGTYRIEYSLSTSTEWFVDTLNATTTSLVVDGLTCGTEYSFRVSALGSGTVYAPEWSEPSEPLEHTTEECNLPPEFATSTYSFTVAENATTTDLVGTVSATDADSDPVSHAITSGNSAGRFAIATSTGDITVAGELDHESVPTYTLVVEATDGREGVATTTVEIEVTDVAEDAPPAPTGLGVSLAGGTFTATWSAVAGASVYELQQQVSGSAEGWAAVAATAGLTQTYSPTGGPACGTTYEFSVRAYGDGTVYAAVWGEPSEPESHTTEACNRAPVFATSTYMFMVAENATTTDLVGTVSATDPDSDPVSYAITSGNSAGRFAIATSTGDITVAGELDHEGVPSYTLVVEARDGRAGVATTTVEIEVTDVAEDAPPAPTGLGVSLAGGTFTATWSAVAGASVYELQQQVSGSAEGWAAVATTAGLTQTYSPTGGPACGTTYEFRVRAYGDGAVYAAVWGAPSEPESHTTETCNRAPVFGASFYTLTISENAATGTSAGAVPATDPDDDPVSHSIISGNGAGKFTIAANTGAITLTGTVDPDEVAFYALTVEASDDEGETSTALVGVAVLLDECSNGAVVPRPRSKPRLVRDCSMLLASKDTLAGDADLDWSADTDISDWQGVTVERGDSPYVRVLFLPDAGLTGSIPAALGGLADLRRIDLDYNSLTGGLPRELGSLYDMELMYLNHNNLTGTIPAELGQLRNLKSLFISSNNLTGGIPVELGVLSNLRHLYLSENNLTGGIPAELGKLSSLKLLLLEGNPLGGEIPSELGDLTRLEHVFLRNIGLTGEIPAAWGDLSNLTSLYISSGNSLTGCIPSGLRDIEEHDLDGSGLDYCN